MTYCKVESLLKVEHNSHWQPKRVQQTVFESAVAAV